MASSIPSISMMRNVQILSQSVFIIVLLLCCSTAMLPMEVEVASPKHKNHQQNHQIKLYYFDFRARGEPIRMALKQAGVPFEDVRVSPEDWPALKPQMPLGQLPVLEVDGEKIGQTLAISRFIGEQFGLAPKNPVVRARLDMIAEYVKEMVDELAVEWWPVLVHMKTVPDPVAHFHETVLPLLGKYAPRLEKFLASNENGLFHSEHEEVTWVEIFTAEAFAHVRDFGAAHKEAVLAPYPHIAALVDHVYGLPAIREHIAQRQQAVVPLRDRQ